MTLKIEIEVPAEWVGQDRGREYVERAMSTLGFVSRESYRDATQSDLFMTASEAAKAAEMRSRGEAAGIILQQAAEAKAEEQTKRTRRTKAQIEAEKQAISTGEERISPQDQADEARDKPVSSGPNHDDLRLAVGRYATRYGMAAAVEDVWKLFGVAVNDVPADGIVKALAALGDAYLNNKFDRKVLDDKAAEPAAIEAAAEPVKPARIGTKQEVIARMLDYVRLVDGPNASPVDISTMPNADADFPKMFEKAFGAGVTNLSKIPADEASYGKALDWLDEMIATNPFKREMK